MRHVLLVEDNPTNRALVEDIFRYNDLPGELVCANSAEEALRMLPSLDPLVVLMDLMLPGMSGVEATRVIKSDPATRHIRVWAITARTARTDIEEALAAGCDGYFTKPVSPAHLAEQLRVFECEEVLDLYAKPQGAPMHTILLIEDNSNSISLMEDMFLFDDIPAQLVSVRTGEEGLNRAFETLPALILMDERLPGIDGLETTQILKRDPRTKDIPVWAITAYARTGDEDLARAAGCCEYITKPVSGPDLANRLRAFLNQLEGQEVLK